MQLSTNRTPFLILLFFVFCGTTFAQGSKYTRDLQQLLQRLEKHNCVLLFPDRDANTEKTRQADDMKSLAELNFHTIDSLFHTGKKELKLQLFLVMCFHHRPEITKEHLAMLDDSQKISVCDGGNTIAEVPLRDLAAMLYQNSVERKEKIRNPEALKLFEAAEELLYNGPVNFAKMISLLDQADDLEPQNPIILDARGSAKFDSQLDVDGAFADFDNAIAYSLDQNVLELRYYNLGLAFLSRGDLTTACEHWQKAGHHGLEYIEEYCAQPFDTVIHANPDSNLVLTLKTDEPTARIVKSHNSPEMSSCYAQLTIRNAGHAPLTISDDQLDYGLESSDRTLCLEAISEDGKKFRFFTETESYTFGAEKSKKLTVGEEYSKKINLTQLHQFPYPGSYQVRIVLRSSKNLRGLQNTYYSNWQTLVIVKDY